MKTEPGHVQDLLRRLDADPWNAHKAPEFRALLDGAKGRTERPRILLVGHYSGISGASRVYLNVARALAQTFDIHCALPIDGPLVPMLERLSKGNIFLGNQRWIPRFSDFLNSQDVSRLPQLVARYVVENRIDVVLTNTAVIVHGAIGAALAGKPHLWYIHESLIGNEGLRPNGCPPESIHQIITALSAAVLTNSENVRGELRESACGGHLYVLHPYVSIATQVEPKNVSDPGAPVGLVFCGEMTRGKGVDVALDVLDTLCRRSSRYRMQLFGNPGPLLPSVRDEMQRRGLKSALTLRGMVTNPWAESRSRPIMLNTSRIETFGLAMLEAVLNGMPVVATPTAGAREVFSDFPGLCALSDSWDPVSLADLVEQTDANYAAASRMVAAQRGDLVARFNEERFTLVLHALAQFALTVPPAVFKQSTAGPLYKAFRRERTRSAAPESGRNTEAIFTSIVENNAWKGERSISGPGSDADQTKILVAELPVLFSELGISSLLDIPCGDFHWMAGIGLGQIDYTGGDIVKTLVQQNAGQYGNPRRRFKHMDLIGDKLPKVDLVLCRDCLVHFSFDDVFAALRNIVSSGSTYLLTTTFPEREANDDIRTGSWRPLNLERAPFHMPAPLRILNEGCTENGGIYHDKSLAFWRIAEIDLKRLTAKRVKP